jgi:hypothetical protein
MDGGVVTQRNRTAAPIELARDRDDTEHVKALAATINDGLRKRPARTSSTVNAASSADAKPTPKTAAPEIEERFQRLRDFDPSALVVVGLDDGDVVPGPRPSSKTTLASAGSGGKGSGNGIGKRGNVRKQYEDKDVESLALAYVIHVLSHTTEQQIEDIRLRRGGGADATIDWRTFVELKSFYGPAPSAIDLTSHECERARTVGRDFILAVVSGLGDDQDLEMRLIVDPLGSTAWEARRGISIKQLSKARAIVIREAAGTEEIEDAANPATDGGNPLVDAYPDHDAG